VKYALRATEVRKNYSRVFEDTVRIRPQVIQKLRDTVFWVSAEHMQTMLAPCRLTLRVRKDSDGSYYGVFDELDIMDTGNDIEQLKSNLAAVLREYAESYINDFPLYYHSPNRRSHLPYVWNVMMQDDLEGVVGLFDAIVE